MNTYPTYQYEMLSWNILLEYAAGKLDTAKRQEVEAYLAVNPEEKEALEGMILLQKNKANQREIEGFLVPSNREVEEVIKTSKPLLNRQVKPFEIIRQLLISPYFVGVAAAVIVLLMILPFFHQKSPKEEFFAENAYRNSAPLKKETENIGIELKNYSLNSHLIESDPTEPKVLLYQGIIASGRLKIEHGSISKVILSGMLNPSYNTSILPLEQTLSFVPGYNMATQWASQTLPILCYSCLYERRAYFDFSVIKGNKINIASAAVNVNSQNTEIYKPPICTHCPFNNLYEVINHFDYYGVELIQEDISFAFDHAPMPILPDYLNKNKSTSPHSKHGWVLRVNGRDLLKEDFYRDVLDRLSRLGW